MTGSGIRAEYRPNQPQNRSTKKAPKRWANHQVSGSNPGWSGMSVSSRVGANDPVRRRLPTNHQPASTPTTTARRRRR